MTGKTHNTDLLKTMPPDQSEYAVPSVLRLQEKRAEMLYGICIFRNDF